METDGSVTELRDVEFYLNGIYDLLQSSNYYGDIMTYYGDLTGDDMKSYKSTSHAVNYYLFKYTKDNASSTIFAHCYEILNNINTVLPQLEELEFVPDSETENVAGATVVSQEYFNDMKGELLTIRALVYFDLTRIYGYPYLKDNGASLSIPLLTEPVGKDAKPARDTVEESYQLIIKDLTEAIALLGEAKKEGKINKWAAMTLLSRAYLYKGDNQNALAIAEEAITGAEKRGYGLWSNEEYAEIWATPFNSELLFEIVNLVTDSEGKSGVGYYYEKYNMIATDKFYKNYLKNSNDVRKELVSSASSSRPYCKKFPAQGNKTYEDCNVPVFRLSELYLNAAEAAIKTGTAEAMEKARKYLAPIYARTTESLDDVATIDLDLVLEQRRIEFWGEGHRFFDLMRNNKKVIRTDYLDEVTEDAREFDWNWYKIVLPMPRSEMNVNENMIDNPEY